MPLGSYDVHLDEARLPIASSQRDRFSRGSVSSPGDIAEIATVDDDMRTAVRCGDSRVGSAVCRAVVSLC